MFRVFSLILLFSFFVSELFGQTDIQRVDMMLKDIATLKKECQERIEQEKQKSLFLEKKLKLYEKELYSLKNQRKKQKKSVVILKVCKDENKFPDLKLKKQ